MKQTGKIDYLELPAAGETLDSVKAFYSAAFGWTFTDYGPTYSGFAEGLDGGFQANATEGALKPLPVLYSEALEATLAEVESAGGSISAIPPATNSRSGANDGQNPILPSLAFFARRDGCARIDAARFPWQVRVTVWRCDCAFRGRCYKAALTSSISTDGA
jgi:predicted enzyme related to lactoylglutathione lyase